MDDTGFPEDDAENELNLAKHDWEIVVNARYKDGLRVGLSEENEEKLQHGFNQGFHSSFAVFSQTARLRGLLIYSNINTESTQENAEEYQQAIKEIQQLEDGIMSALKTRRYSNLTHLLLRLGENTVLSPFITQMVIDTFNSCVENLKTP